MGLSYRQKLVFLSITGALSFAVLVDVAVNFNFVPKIIFNIYMGVSLFTFILYFIDKLAARKGWVRIRENTLHFFALIGGWPGALVAQQVFRHKTRKQPFRSIFWVMVVFNCTLFASLFTEVGSSMFRTFMNSYVN